MKRILVALSIMVGCQCRQEQMPAAPSPPPQVAPSYEVYFSPNGGCEQATVRHIDAAKREVLVQAYSFTNRAITDALIRAKNRGVRVQLVLDRSDVTAKGATLEDLRSERMDVVIDRKHAIAHNKVIVYDGRVVLTGSFNFTSAAEHANAENCLFIDDANLAARYQANWRVHHDHSD